MQLQICLTTQCAIAMEAIAPLELLDILQLRELRERLLDAADVQTRVRLRAVSSQLQRWVEESLQQLRWTPPLSGPSAGDWSNRLGELLDQSGQPARWPARAAFAHAHTHAVGDPSSQRRGVQSLRLLDISLRTWPAAARALSSRDVRDLISEARGCLCTLRLDDADAVLPLPARVALFSKGTAYHAKVTMLPHLCELSAMRAFGVGDDEATALALGCPQLRRLRISHDNISPGGWYELLSSLHGLDELDVQSSSVNDAALLQPGSLLAPTLICQCEPGECRCSAKRRALRRFKVASCPGVTDAALRQLLDRLRPITATRGPTATKTRIMLPPPGWLSELHQNQGPSDDYLCRQANLTAINIDSCGVSSGLELVAEAACAGHLPGLTELGLRDGQLRRSNVTDDASNIMEQQATWLQTVLKHCSGLTHLDVRGCVDFGCATQEPADLERPLRSLRSCSAGFLLPILVGSLGSVPDALCLPNMLVELRLGLGARVNDLLLCAVASSGSKTSLRSVGLAFAVFEDSGLVRCVSMC